MEDNLNDIGIERYKPQFFEGILYVIDRVLYGEFGFDREDSLDYDLNDIEAEYCNNGGIFLVVVTKRGEVIGTGALRKLTPTTCEVKRMYLFPEYRGIGLGRALMEKLLEFAKKEGYKRVVLDSTRDMKRALALYRSFGFVKTSNYNNNPRANIFMEKIL